ncbi:MAG: 23S rRNA (adenine(2503)-C(2))-methyltransferase RlmN [Treponema sp.]|jgi:23S rRNA (adenine2503-C2)-methyltransferase|nr:23S rRNA (adenine(2503)-C(2))-methyltransferase RlmN [Treponema sp.]
MKALFKLSLSELERELSFLPRFRAKQIFQWILKGISGFDEMTDLPAALREDLKMRFSLFSSAVHGCHDDTGARKIVLELKDSLKIEAVLLSDEINRMTACLSTQAGCPIGCVFCKTGSLGFKRNLESAEIAEQFLFLLNLVRDNLTQEKKTGGHLIENIVIMGMGEPLLNLPELRGAISFFTSADTFNFSKRRITVSTCGICDGLEDLAQNGPYIRLALSLVTANEQLRQRLIPASRANPLDKIREALIQYQQKSGNRITLEIPLLGGINTSDQNAYSIAEFSKGIDSIVNIIPWNPVAELEFEGMFLREPTTRETQNFIAKLESLGMKVTTRYRKGRGVCGACGQLG